MTFASRTKNVLEVGAYVVLAGGFIGGIAHFLISKGSNKDMSIWEKWNAGGRLEQIMHNSNEIIFDKMDDEDFMSNTAFIQTTKNDITYKFQLDSKGQKGGRSNIIATIETVPDEKGNFSYRIITKKNTQAFSLGEWSESKVTIGKNKKEVFTGYYKNSDKIKPGTFKAEKILEEKKEKRKNKIWDDALLKQYWQNEEDIDSVLMNRIMDNDYNIIEVDTNNKTYTFIVRGYEINSESQIEIIQHTNPRAEEEIYELSDLDRSTRRQIKDTYNLVGEILLDKAKAYKQEVKDAVNLKGVILPKEQARIDKNNKVNEYFNDINKGE